MLKEIRMPNLGTTADEIKIIRWLKTEGERVERGEPLFEVETDKAAMEVESFVAGYLKKIVAHPEEEVATGRIIAYIGELEDVYGEPAVKNAQAHAPVANQKEEAPPERREIKISPMVRKLAEKMGVNIAKIKGTGPDGLILKDDVLKAASGLRDEAEEKDEKEQVIPFTRIGQAIANAMGTSKSTIPHVYFGMDVDASAMMEARATSGKTISYNAMILHAVAETLRDFPYLASRYTPEGRVLASNINIGFAAARGDDLFVPVVKGIGQGGLDVKGVEAEVQRLTDAVRTGGLKQEDISGGVFTVSNLGAYGVSSFTAVINPPEAAILAVGSIQDRVIVVDKGIHIRPIFTMTLSVDHRVANGAYAAGFLKALKEKLETLKG